MKTSQRVVNRLLTPVKGSSAPTHIFALLKSLPVEYMTMTNADDWVLSARRYKNIKQNLLAKGSVDFFFPN